MIITSRFDQNDFWLSKKTTTWKSFYSFVINKFPSYFTITWHRYLHNLHCRNTRRSKPQIFLQHPCNNHLGDQENHQQTNYRDDLPPFFFTFECTQQTHRQDQGRSQKYWKRCRRIEKENKSLEMNSHKFQNFCPDIGHKKWTHKRLSLLPTHTYPQIELNKNKNNPTNRLNWSSKDGWRMAKLKRRQRKWCCAWQKTNGAKKWILWRQTNEIEICPNRQLLI